MSMFCSKIKAVRELRFEPIPTRPIAVVRAVSHEGVTAMLGKDNRIYTNAVEKNTCYGNTTEFRSNLFHCCLKLGVLSARAVKEHNEYEAKLAKQRDDRWAAERLFTASNELGLMLTVSQLLAIRRILPSIGKNANPLGRGFVNR